MKFPKGKWANLTDYRSVKKISHRGFSFASKLEAALYDLLKLRELDGNGKAKDILVQNTVYLTNARIIYIADFKFFDCRRGCETWAEAKGFETDVWRIKRRLWMHYGPGPLEVYKGSAESIRLHEVIIPKITHP